MALFPSGFWSSTKKIRPLLLISILPRKLGSFGGKESASQELYTAAWFDSSLQTCTDIRSLRKLHACIFMYGLGNNIFLGSKLLNCYANFGSLPESRWVFDKIINRNLSLWNSAIVGYFRAGHFGEVLWLYVDLKLRGVGVDSSAITFSLKSCIELKTVEFGRGIHADAFKVSLNGDKFVGSSLIGLYSKCGDIKDVERVFDEILDKDIVAYTTVVTYYAQLSDFHARKAFGIARYMQREGLNPNRVTLVSLLQAAGQLEALKEGRSVHCYALRRGISLSDEVLETSLVDMYAKCGARAVAGTILRRMGKSSVAPWNAMIASLIHSGQPLEALDIFFLMKQDENLSPDSITLANVLLACADLNCIQQVTSIHAYIIRREIPLDLVVTTTLIDTYLKCHKLKSACELFDRLTIRDVILYNVMIFGYLQLGSVDEAIKMFSRMVKADVRPNSATMLSLLSAFADIAEIRKGRWIHGFALRYGLESDVDVSNQILHMYAKCGCIDIAKEIFEQITNKNLVSWTAMMMGYVNHGHADEALTLFKLMQGMGVKPDSVTLVTLLQAVSQLGCVKQAKEIHGYTYRIWLERDVATINSTIMAYAKCGKLDIAEFAFKNLPERGQSSWNTMIAAYGIHGYCREALDLFHRMRRENVMPDGVTFTSLLSACSHGGLVEEGWSVFYSMNDEYSVAPQEEHYNCMVDLLGRAGQLEEAFEFLQRSPLKDRTSALGALLGACRIHRKMELGEVIGNQLLDLEPQNSGTYTLVSNIYAQAGMWSEAAKLRVISRERGVRKIPGYSLIESNKAVSGT